MPVTPPGLALNGEPQRNNTHKITHSGKHGNQVTTPQNVGTPTHRENRLIHTNTHTNTHVLQRATRTGAYQAIHKHSHVPQNRPTCHGHCAIELEKRVAILRVLQHTPNVHQTDFRIVAWRIRGHNQCTTACVVDAQDRSLMVVHVRSPRPSQTGRRTRWDQVTFEHVRTLIGLHLRIPWIRPVQRPTKLGRCANTANAPDTCKHTEHAPIKRAQMETSKVKRNAAHTTTSEQMNSHSIQPKYHKPNTGTCEIRSVRTRTKYNS